MKIVLRRAKAFSLDKLPWAALIAALDPALEDLVADATSGAIAVALARGLHFDPEKIAATMADMLPAYIDAWEKAVIDTTRERVSLAVEAYTAGDIGLDELMARVDTLFDPARAELIAINETTRLYDVVGNLINTDAGVEMVRFLTVRDFAVCPICEDLDNEVFEVENAPQPPDDTHPGCRCFLSPEVPEAVDLPTVVAA